MNFELIDNSFQITILGFCTIAALFLALRYKSRSLLILALAYACFCMGTTYYILYLVIMGKVPQVFYVAEISWLAASFCRYFCIWFPILYRIIPALTFILPWTLH